MVPWPQRHGTSPPTRTNKPASHADRDCSLKAAMHQHITIASSSQHCERDVIFAGIIPLNPAATDDQVTFSRLFLPPTLPAFQNLLNITHQQITS